MALRLCGFQPVFDKVGVNEDKCGLLFHFITGNQSHSDELPLLCSKGIRAHFFIWGRLFGAGSHAFTNVFQKDATS